MAEREAPHRRADYPHALVITTRWMDNDVYGHVNNVVYYSYFDTVVNGYLMREGVLDPASSPVIGLVVETGCKYFASLTYPETVTAGLRVAKLGRSSVRYEIALSRAIGIPDGLAGVGYGADDIDALVEGTLPQQRLLANAPCEVDAACLRELFTGALRY